MFKKIISLLLSAVIFTGAISIFGAMPASASDFETQLKEAGFPSIYISKLTELHNKYPNWKFEPLITGVDWSKAVAQERTPHSQQLIQETSSNAANGYYCSCSSCYKNGSYVIQEGRSWVSASQSAVEHYMNPTNFLDEKHIFQFEAIDYNENQGKAGIETILKNTWMYNSLIVYKTADGRSVTYTNSLYTSGAKYSDAIYEAAKASGLSAYYLASKIVQEVGGKTNSAIGACGTNSTYPGIYNYYNIGAYTGGLDGLKWAATQSDGYITNARVNLRQGPSTSTTKLVTLPSGTKVNYISLTDKQSDGYRWYNVSVTYNSTSYNGYIREDLLTYTSTDKYKRPWTNPFISIYNGAKYIANNFSKTQNTGYLQKFNVNPASSNMYGHEYMANVQAAASEALNTYNAYNSAGLLSTEKTFLIPVFNNMPGMKQYSSDIPKVVNIQPYDITETTASIVCDVVPGATGYDLVRIENGDTSNRIFVKSFNSRRTTITGLTGGTTYTYMMRAYIIKDGVITYSTNYSDPFTITTTPKKVTGLATTARGSNGKTLTISWDKQSNVTKYNVYAYNQPADSWTLMGSTTNNKFVFENVTPGYEYSYRAAAVNTTGEGTPSDTLHTCAACETMKAPSVNGIDDKTIRADWEIVGSHGYVVMWSKDQTFSTGTSYKYITGHSVSSYTFNVPSGANQYYVRVRAWRNWDTGYVYGAWSDGIKPGQPAKVTGVATTARGSNGKTLTISWDKQSNVTKYNVYAYNKPADSWTLMGSTTNNKFVFENVTPGYEYSYRVVAVNSTVEGIPSDTLHTCAACETMKAPTVQKSGAQIKVGWELVGSHGYVVMWSTDPDFKENVSHKYITGHSVNSYTITGISSNKTYYVRVRAWRNWDTGYVYGAWSDNAVAK